MKLCPTCQFLNLSKSYACLRCNELLSVADADGRPLPEPEPYVFVGEIANCLREKSFSEDQQTEFLEKIIHQITQEEANLAGVVAPECQPGVASIRRGIKKLRFLVQEAWNEGQSWPLEEWDPWLQDCDEAEAEIVNGIDLIEFQGHPCPISIFPAGVPS